VDLTESKAVRTGGLMTMKLLLPSILGSALALACGGGQPSPDSPESPDPDTSREVEEAGEAVGEEIEEGAEDVAEEVDEAVEDVQD
jgi:hypothetical protein